MGQDWIPVEVRAWVYRTLGVLAGLEIIFDFVSTGVEQKIAAVAALFGFSLAAVHTPTKGS